MRYVSLCKLPLFMAMAMLTFCCQGNLNAEKDSEDLEEALMMKLLEKRAKKRTDDDKPSRFDKSDLKSLKDDKSEISITVVNDIKGMMKEPVLELLATSELSSWSDLADRVSKAKKSIEIFEVKYRSELASGGKAATPAAPMAMPGATVMPGAVTMPGAMPAVKPVGMPGAVTMPGAMPGAKPAGMPGVMPTVKPVGMPGVKPAVKAAAADDDDDDDEDETPAKPVMKPAMKPAGMPGLGGMPGAMPMAQPAGMPGVAPAAVVGGMPMAR